MPKIGATELIIILVIILVIFGAGKLPGIGKALGQSMREFRKAKGGDDESKTKEKTAETAASAQTETKSEEKKQS